MNQSIMVELELRAKELLPEKALEIISKIRSDNQKLRSEGYLPQFDAAARDGVYKAICGYSAYDCKTIDEYFNPEIAATLNSFFGEEEAGRIREECALVMEVPYRFSISIQLNQPYHPPYRSGRIRDHIDTFFTIAEDAIAFMCHDLTLEQAMAPGAPQQRLINRLALALRQGDGNAFDIIKEAILGDNDNIQFSRRIIQAIVRSGASEALELLGKMLLAAKAQEGLRQAILESCDCGVISSHAYFLRLIIENDMCRFSSVIRALDTWTGLGLVNQKHKAAEKCMSLAYKYLSDENAINDGIESNDAIEIYIALWAAACRDLYNATGYSRLLLSRDEKYRRLVGWYFITHTASFDFRHNLAIEHLDIRDPEELAWVCQNLDIDFDDHRYMWQDISEEELLVKTYPHQNYPGDPVARSALFDKIAEVAVFVGNKNKMFNESVFPWYSIGLTAEKPCMCLIILCAYDRSTELTVKLAEYLPYMSVTQRMIFYKLLLNPNIAEQRTLLLAGLFDKSPGVKKTILERLEEYSLEDDEISLLTQTLTTTKADLRKSIITLLSKLSETQITPVLKTLIQVKNKNQLIAGIELLKVFGQENPALIAEHDAVLSALADDQELGLDVAILLNRITIGSDEYSAENGYGLYDPAADVFNRDYWEGNRPAIAYMNDNEIRSCVVPDKESVYELYENIADVFYRNRDYEYETDSGDPWSGSRQKVLLSDEPYRVLLPAGKQYKRFGNPITDYPLADEWIKVAGEYAEDKQKLAALICWMQLFGYPYGNRMKYLKWFSDLFEGILVVGDENVLVERIEAHISPKGATIIKASQILEAILSTGQNDLFDFAFSIYFNIIKRIPSARLGDIFVDEGIETGGYNNLSHYDYEQYRVLSAPPLAHWRNLAYRCINSDSQFSIWFREMWYEYLASGSKFYYGITDNDMYRAHHLGLIPDDAIYAYFTTAYQAEEHMRNASVYSSGWSREILSKYPATKEILDNAIDRVVSIEENRGELPTELSGVAVNIGRFYGGIKHFVKLLAAMGETGFHRGYMYYWRTEITKKESLSYLLRMCRPAPGDTPEALREVIKQAKIPEKRLFQIALYAPLWAGMLERSMGISGLKCGVWFFHAHVNEYFSSEKETETAVFSSITPQRFIDGTFDKDWFHEAYSALGANKFNELYKNAKYITDSSSAHRRSQLYADAVLGRMDKASAKSEIIEKRNQEKLRAYALIPLDDNNKNDALERYEFIGQFRKESRQFGSQKQASEEKACQIALENLAITTGYDDVDRMTWALESAKSEQLAPLMEPCVIDDAEVWLSFTDNGDPDMIVRKNGKVLKTLPKELQKDPYVIEMKGIIKQLREQKRRARFSFEMAMVSRSSFSVLELSKLLGHPVLKEMISMLIFAAGDAFGFPGQENGRTSLIGISGEIHELEENDKLLIAHPHDFINRNCWSEYQHHLFQEQIKQPFKQVFREYYPITADESASVNISRRYAGNQLQPRKAVALFKARGWTADYEEGLQRVWHKENLIARMYALADWFSPSEMEVPTLEAIQFFSRDRYEPIPFADVPPVIFSETMRDVDLAISIAHVGGVDPEASHSSIETRIAIARELLDMLKVLNVKFTTAHAQISGILGEYSVHMGSGVVHMSGVGMISVLPVHSQSRGRIFLPFADNDPKTAEILSKILLFADDKKIKDPGILSQIK